MRPVILAFARYYLPGQMAGGPIRTIANMVERLSDTFEFWIVASDRDLGATSPYAGVRYGEWIPTGKALVQYVDPGFGMLQLLQIMRSTPHDAIYLNSFFDRRFTQQILLAHYLRLIPARPIVVAPRGEFSSGALALKPLRKALFIKIARATWLRDSLTWQASSGQEARDIHRSLSVDENGAANGRTVIAANIVVAPDLIDCDIASSVAGSRGAETKTPMLRACFLSRISPMKNLDYALRVLTHVSAAVRFTIYGPCEDRPYWEICQALIAKLPSNVEVVYSGEVESDQVVNTLATHQMLILPTQGENFGHVIFEALCAGLAVLISDRTPWTDLAERGVGWSLSLADAPGFARAIDEAAGWTGEQWANCRTRARQLASTFSHDRSGLEANRRLFADVTHG